MFDTLQKIANVNLDELVTDVRGYLAKEEAKHVYLRILAKECLEKIRNINES